MEPEERLLAAVIKRAIRDAKEGPTEKLRSEAAVWCWMVAPAIAERVAVPDVPLPAEVARQWWDR